MILDIIAGIISGALGAMGFGGGGILILYLTLYRNLPQTASQGINLLFFIPSAVLAIIFHIKNNGRYGLFLIFCHFFSSLLHGF